MMRRQLTGWPGPQARAGHGTLRWWVALAALLLLAGLGRVARGQTLPVTSGLRLHLKADAGVTSSGGTVSAWADQSGNGFDVAQATAGQRPALAGLAANGRPALVLDGNDDWLESKVSVDLLGGQTSYTFFAVTRPGTTQKQYADIFDYNHTTNVRFVFQQDGNNTNSFYNNGLAAQTLPTASFSLLSGTFQNGSTVVSRLNGGNPLIATGAAGTFGTPNYFRVGNWVSGGREFNGQIAEVLLFNRVLTAAEIGQVETYLSNKYGITTPANTPASGPTLTAVTPARNAASATRGSDVTLTFSQALSSASASATALKVFGGYSGLRAASYSGGGTSTLTIDPTADFRAGERVEVTATQAAQSSAGNVPLARGYVSQFTAAAGPATGTLNGSTDLTANRPVQVAAGDFNNDGLLDLVAANYQGGTGVYLNAGNGTFGAATVYGSGQIHSVTTGDVDGDGDLDVVAASYSSALAYVFFNNGSGSFPTSNSVSVNGSSTDADLGDLDGDGDLDLVLSNYANNTVSLRFNNGSGVFSGSATLSTGAWAIGAVLTDVDHDGDLDVAVSRYNGNSVYVFANDGSGGFGSTPSTTITTGANPYWLAAGDLDNDGYVDLAVPNYGGNSVTLAWGSSAGTFTTTTLSTGFDSPTVACVGDVDGDGRLDLALASRNTATAYVVRNLGSRSFGTPASLTTQALSYHAVLADLNNDNALDLATANYGNGSGNTLSVRLNTPLAVPVITSFAPTSGTVGNTVTVSGTNLSGITGVTLNGVAANTFNSVSSTQLTFVVPTGATTGPIAVTNPQGTGTTAALATPNYTVLGAPTISGFTPTSAGAGTPVAISGTNLLGVTGVLFGGVPAASFAAASNTSLSATPAPGGASGPITLLYGGGQSVSSSQQFTFLLPNITRVEYFIDADPGFGSATAVTLGTGSDQAGLTASVALGSLAAGFHQLGVRSQDASGNWSLTSRQTFYYEPSATASLPNIDKAEYFIDADPGTGSATDVPLTPAADVAGLAVAVNLSSLAAGFHQLGVRSRDTNGKWSLTSRQAFYYEPSATASLPNINKVEYFLDADPGFGSGTDVPVTAAPDVAGLAVAVNLSSVAAGFHTLSVRSRDANGKWSLTSVRSFYYEQPAAGLANVVKVEYFLDADPGFGSGVNVPITVGADVSGVSLAVDLSSVAAGFHTLSVRSQDAAGKWSLTSVRSFYYEPTLAVAPNINKVEYFFDTDPGFGSGTDVPVTAAPDLPSVSFTADASALADGPHRIWVRSRDANGKWSLVWSRSFVKNGCASSANLAAGLPASSYGQSATYNGSAQTAFNGTEEWGANGYSGSIQVDLGSAQRVSEVRYAGRVNPASAVTYTIQVSTNLSTWTTVDSYTTSLPATNAGTYTSIVRTLATPATGVRGLRIIASGSSSWVVLANAGVYDFNCAGPTIVSFTPAGGAGGTPVTITGTNFTGATAVTFNGVAAQNFSVTSGTQISAVAPAGGSTGQICVTTPGGTACSAANYVYPPTIATGTVSASAFCSTTLLDVPFTTNMSAYGTGNTFSFQLSDANGVFTPGSRLYGNLVSSSATGGTLRDSVAFRTPAGTGYRVRVVASNPAVVGSDNGSNLTVYGVPAATAAASPTTVAYNGSFQLTAGPAGQASYQWYVAYTSGGTAYVGSGQTLTRSSAQPGQSGKYYVVVQNASGCQDSASVRVLINPSAQPILTMAQFGYSGCAGNSVNIGFGVQGNDFASGNAIMAQLSDASGSFAAPITIGSVNFSGQGPGTVTATFPASTPTGTGYRVRLMGSSPAVTSQTDNGSNLTLKQQPTAVASSNSPVPYGGTIQLTAQPVAGASYLWTGPSGFASTQQNPTIPNATQSGNQGTYSLYVTVNGCQSPAATTVVTVSPSTDPILSVGQFSGSFCGGASFSVSFSVTGNSFASGNQLTAQLSDANGSFAVPTDIGAVAFSGQGGGNVPVTLPNPSGAGTGYRVRLRGSSPAVVSINDNGSNLTISPTPTAAIVGNNSPVASGGTVTLTAQAVSGATYAWNVPGFGTVSTGSSPTLNFANAITANSGTYTVQVTLGTCAASATAAVTVQPGPATLTLTSTASQQVCAGGTGSLGFTVGGAGLGSNGSVAAQLSDEAGSFASPSVIGSVSFTGTGSATVGYTLPTSAVSGSLYRVRLVSTDPALTSNQSNIWSLTNLTGVTASSNSPVAAGGTIQLTAGGVPAGATLQWTGPAGFNTPNPNPSIPNASASNAGTYALSVTQGGCTAVRTLAVTVGPAAATLATGSFGGSFCPGSPLSVPFTASGFTSGNSYQAQLSDASGSFAAPVVIGTLPSTAGSGSIAAQIPAGTTPGTGYRIRVVGTSPAVTGTDNGQDLTVGPVGYTWTGGYSTDWFDGRNWSCGLVPTSTSTVTIGLAPTYPVVTGTTAVVNNITVVSGATFQVTGSFTIYGNVVSNGTWVTGGSYVFAGSGTQTVSGSTAVYFGGVIINAGATVSLGTGLYVSGNWVNNGGFAGGTYVVNFNGTVAQYLGGSAATYFYGLTISNLVGLSLQQNVYVAGNWVNNGVFVAGTYLTTFNGTALQTITGTSTTNFYGLTIANAVGVSLGGGIGVAGPLTNNGVFTVGTQTVTFNGTVAQVIGGTTQTTFYTVVISNLVGVTLASNIYVLGDWLNDGQFTAGSYTVIFAGTVAQVIGGSVVTNFYNVTFQNAVSVTLHQHIYVLGAFVNTGVFYGYYSPGGVLTGYYVRFGGTTAQVVTANATTYFYHFYVDNAAGVTLASNVYIAGNYYLYAGSFAPAGYVVYFTGTGGVVQTVGGYTALSFYGWNIGSGATVRLLQSVTLTGSFVNAGIFYGYNLVGGVYTGYTVTFGGAAAQVLSGAGAFNFWHVTWNNAVSVTLQQDVYVLGNWLNNGGFAAGNSTVYFNGTVAQVIGGAVGTTFYHVSIGNAVSVGLAQTVVVLGNWLGSGIFLANGYLTTFSGTALQTITVSASTRFADLRFNNAAGVRLLSDLYLTGAWIHDGGFLANGYAVYFVGSAEQLIGGTVLPTFHHLIIGSGASVRLTRAVTVLGDWTTNGTFLASSYAVTFAGTANQVIGGTVLTAFFGVVITNAVSVTLAQDIRVRGGWTNNGVFVPATYTVYFDGTAAQVIGGSATTFYHLTIANAVGVSLSAPVFIGGNLVNNGLLSCAGYLVTFNGTAAQTIGGSSVTIFGGVTFNNAVGVSLLQDVRVRGDFRNLAVFAASGRVVYFDGSVAQGIYSTGTLTFHDVTFANLAGVTLYNDVFVTGLWVNNGGFLAGGRRVTFKGTTLQTIGGTVATTFYHFAIASGATVRPLYNLTILGDWTNGGTFQANSLLVTFAGTAAQTLGGTVLTAFYDVTFSNAAGVSLGYDVDVTRNFVNSGGFCGCGHRVRFNGSGAQTIACTSGNTHFHDLTFSNAAGVTLLDGIYVSGLWVNDGGYIANNQLVVFDGPALQTIGGTALTSFWNVKITNLVNVQLLHDIAVGGYWLNNGIFTGNGYLTTFNGTAQQTITTSGAGSKTTFHHVTWANLVGCVLAGDVYVTGNWLGNGPFDPATWTVYFNGTAAQTCGGSAQLKFYGLNVSNPLGVTWSKPVYLYGNFVNTGLVNCGPYAWYCVGSTGQTIGGVSATPTRFYDLYIQNPGGVTATDDWYVTHLLTLPTGNLASNGHLTLTSNAGGTAMVVNPPGGGVVTGRATMERFIKGLGAPGYRHYASPMQLGTATVQEFADDLPVFELNPAYNTVGNTVKPFPTLFQYDETRLTSAATNYFDRGWMVPAATDNLLPGRGYSAQTDPTTTVDISGTLQTGTVTYPLTRGSYGLSGYQLLGNPYPAPINWDLVPSAPGLDKTLYVYTPTGKYTGTYSSYAGGVGQNGGTPDLAAMQGFFVRATAATATLTMTNAVRATSYLSPGFSRPAETRPILRLEARSAANLADETVLYFEPGAGPGYQPSRDANKLTLNGTGRPTLWSVAGPDALAINGLDDLATAGVVPLGVRVSVAGAHTLVLTSKLNLPAGTQVTLEDRLLNRRQNLALDSVYSFTSHPDSVRQRFYLWLKPGSALSAQPGNEAAALSTALYPNPTAGRTTLEVTGLQAQPAVAAEVFDAVGRRVRLLSLPVRQGAISQVLDLRELPGGVYTLRLHPQEGTLVRKLVRE